MSLGNCTSRGVASAFLALNPVSAVSWAPDPPLSCIGRQLAKPTACCRSSCTPNRVSALAIRQSRVNPLPLLSPPSTRFSSATAQLRPFGHGGGKRLSVVKGDVEVNGIGTEVEHEVAGQHPLADGDAPFQPQLQCLLAALAFVVARRKAFQLKDGNNH